LTIAPPPPADNVHIQVLDPGGERLSRMWIMFVEDFLSNIVAIFATGVGFHKGFSRV
jgi:hypothetical protein